MGVKYATEVHKTKNELYGKCNTGVLVIKKKVKIGMLYTWVNSERIVKTLSIKIQRGMDIALLMLLRNNG